MSKKWNLKEIILMSILGVVFGIIYLLFFFVGQGITTLLTPLGLGPLGYEFIFGIWFIVSIIAAYIIRKPGVALTAEVIAAVVEVLMGTTAGPTLILSGFIQGLGAELAFALTGWRKYTLPVLMLSGVTAACVSFGYHLYASGIIALESWIIIASLIIRIISGAILAGILGKWIGDQLAKTGVLRGYALGKELREKRESQAI
ncbi:ECF transporter S component [Ornithinibacillus sp. BX22]|uniref:ECF transporter S component n=2 Tax=Ornithinibacillus TaxID=484508 RepID=A0A923L6L0_9BACI|nr:MULTISPECIES: ECF transporter S component [Ornithinibacillus]MBC5637389.1 ECF transporter S component [Ornithinibacillus hominis]MBS3680304.1 ECF transporter S component [Ornithinibacillus massiliensis]